MDQGIHNFQNICHNIINSGLHLLKLIAECLMMDMFNFAYRFHDIKPTSFVNGCFVAGATPAVDNNVTFSRLYMNY